MLKKFPKQVLIALCKFTQKRERFLNEKNVKITKRAPAFIGYASSDNVEILNSFNPES